MNVWCVIPVYNNAAAAPGVIRACRARMEHVLVVDDGSTDADYSALCRELGVMLVRHPENCGKGAALCTALKTLSARSDADYMITIDADGQHDPDDIPSFFPHLSGNCDTVVVGCRDFSVPNVPASSKFGRAFANFWMLAETGVSAGDCQSGFRAYPVRLISQIHFNSKHYNFEAEVLTRAAWAGLTIVSIPIHVHYPPPEQRVSHFKPFRDNFRFAVTHAQLVLRRLLPVPVKRLVPRKKSKFSIFRPRELLNALLKENASPLGLAFSAGTGTFLAVIPAPGCHILLILYVTARLHLNKVMALAVQNLFMPPLSPFLCIEAGYFMRTGSFLTEGSVQIVFREAHYRLYEWFLGSLILAPFWAIVIGYITWCCAVRLQKGRNTHE